MSNSGKFYNLRRESRRNSFFKEYKNNDNVTNIMLAIIDSMIRINTPKTIIDLGTGNGFLIKKTYYRNENFLRSTRLIGIDSSKEMIKFANEGNDKKIEFIVMDNNQLLFPDEYFDMIIAKAVSNISIPEIYRVLKKDGTFIYKEYGTGKGIVEIMELLKNSRAKNNKVLAAMRDIGFSSIELRDYYIPVKRACQESHDLVDTMRILPRGIKRQDAHRIIDNFYTDKKIIPIHSDPYIIIGVK